MDETLAHAAVDVSGGTVLVHTASRTTWWSSPRRCQHAVPHRDQPARVRTLAFNARIALNKLCAPSRPAIRHHITEAEYKAVARALEPGRRVRPAGLRCPVTKGTCNRGRCEKGCGAGLRVRQLRSAQRAVERSAPRSR
jgi:imidazoleglycerol phosphate dehydratase HisB